LKIIIKSFVPPQNYKDNNENSIVLKLIGAFEIKETSGIKKNNVGKKGK